MAPRSQPVYRYDSIYPIFDIFRASWIAERTDYDEATLRRFAKGEMVPTKKFVNSCKRATNWTAVELFGAALGREYDEKVNFPR